MTDIKNTTAIEWVQIAEQVSDPSTPASGQARFFVRADGTPCVIIDSGAVHVLNASATVVQVVNYQTGEIATTSTVIPYDDTIPQNTEGGEFMTLAITPTNASNYLDIETTFYGDTSVASWITVALFQDLVAGARAAGAEYSAAAGGGSGVSFKYRMLAGTTSATTFKIRAGMYVAGTLTFNGQAGARRFGGVMSSSITITEVVP